MSTRVNVELRRGKKAHWPFIPKHGRVEREFSEAWLLPFGWSAGRLSSQIRKLHFLPTSELKQKGYIKYFWYLREGNVSVRVGGESW